MEEKSRSGKKGAEEPQLRIKKAALRLFAQKGYASVGVREIARTARVNLSMISYYYAGKAGVLKSIMQDFFQNYLHMFDIPQAESKTPEECAHEVVTNIVRFVRENLELASVAYNELPLDMPEIARMKAESVARMIQHTGWLIQRFGLDPADHLRIGVIGPSIFSVIMMHFRTRHIQQKVFGFRFDDRFYARFSEAVTTLFLHGIYGLANPSSESKGRYHV